MEVTALYRHLRKASTEAKKVCNADTLFHEAAYATIVGKAIEYLQDKKLWRV